MIYFDRKTLLILWCIKRSGDNGVTWGYLRKKYGEDDANSFLLESLSKELYTVTKDQNGEWISEWNTAIYDSFRSFCTAKGNEILEKRLFDFWKWIIPTLISVAALVVSCLK
ncbi:MAG: hypothetical protein E6579_11640 [Clostridium sp.]|nr:hypothetical protein [Clostridium sp.]